MKLSQCETITDEKKFLEYHTAISEANQHHTFNPYRERLKKYHELKSQTIKAETV